MECPSSCRTLDQPAQPRFCPATRCGYLSTILGAFRRVLNGCHPFTSIFRIDVPYLHVSTESRNVPSVYVEYYVILFICHSIIAGRGPRTDAA